MRGLNYMKRHNGRIIAVLTLYNMDINKLTVEETINAFNTITALEAEEEYPVDIDYEYGLKIVKGVCDNLYIVDDIIIKSLVKYTIDRLSYVDRALIRVCTYEMKFLEVDAKVAINEALEITREYCSTDNDKQVKFNNKLLDNISKVIYE